MRKYRCDFCDIELTTNYIKMLVQEPIKNEDGKVISNHTHRVDLCDDCYNKMKKILAEGKNGISF